MSGLCAVIAHDDQPIDPGLVRRMAAVVPHRGQAVFDLSGQAHLATLTHRSMDHGPAAKTPHRSHISVVASARIDNRDDLVPHLRAHLDTAHPSDVDLIRGAYLRWGSCAPEHLIGDFAYVVFDHAHRRLHAARDPMAMRPLYYLHTPQRTFIASEVQQILATSMVAAEVNEPSVARYLIGEFGVPDQTAYVDVNALPAGHRLDIDDRGVQVEQFWTFDPERRDRFRTEGEYAERFRELFLQAVRDRARGTRPIGMFLSGGVDSGSLASALGWLRERGALHAPLHAYSWAYESLHQCDERHLSDLVVRRYGLQAHDVAAEASGPLARYPQHGPHRDEPYIGVYQALLEASLAAAQRDGVDDVWSGDRGDLVSGAWSPSYWALFRRRRWRDLMGELREHTAVPGQTWPAVVGNYLLAPGVRAVLRRWSRRKRTSNAPRHDVRRPPWLRTEFLTRTRTDPAVAHDAVPPPGWVGFARRERFRLVLMPLHMRGMVWSERTNAAYGLGFVDPWSDRRLAEFVLAIPQAVLNRPGELRKRLVREAMRDIMPEELRRNATKIVPMPLFDRALRRDRVDIVRDLVTDMEADRRGYLDGAALRTHYEEILAGGRPHVTLWWALTLEMWLRRYWR